MGNSNIRALSIFTVGANINLSGNYLISQAFQARINELDYICSHCDIFIKLRRIAMAIAETVKNYLTQKSIYYDLVTHPHTGSSHESALASHVREDHIAKGVIVKDDQGYAMVLVPAINYIDMKHLRRELDRELKLAEEDEFAQLLPDCEPGAVPPVGQAYHIETFLDESLTSLANIYFEAGDHENLVHISGDDFKSLQSGVRRGHYSNEI
jgi:Ala-tRNA(Pro) deacylase